MTRYRYRGRLNRSLAAASVYAAMFESGHLYKYAASTHTLSRTQPPATLHSTAGRSFRVLARCFVKSSMRFSTADSWLSSWMVGTVNEVDGAAEKKEEDIALRTGGALRAGQRQENREDLTRQDHLAAASMHARVRAEAKRGCPHATWTRWNLQRHRRCCCAHVDVIYYMLFYLLARCIRRVSPLPRLRVSFHFYRYTVQHKQCRPVCPRTRQTQGSCPLARAVLPLLGRTAAGELLQLLLLLPLHQRPARERGRQRQFQVRRAITCNAVYMI